MNRADELSTPADAAHPNRRIALHEAGHAVMAYVCGAQVQCVRLVQRRHGSGFQHGGTRWRLESRDPAEHLRCVVRIKLAGLAALELAYGWDAAAAGAAMDQATALKYCRERMPTWLDAQRLRFVQEQYAAAARTLVQAWPAVEAVATRVEAVGELEGAAARSLIATTLPRQSSDA